MPTSEGICVQSVRPEVYHLVVKLDLGTAVIIKCSVKCQRFVIISKLFNEKPYTSTLSRIAIVKAAFSNKKTLFTSKLDLNLRKKLITC